LARLLRVTFGRSSEKLSARVEQLDLLLTEIDEQLAEIAPADEPVGDDSEDHTRKPVRGLSRRRCHATLSNIPPV